MRISKPKRNTLIVSLVLAGFGVLGLVGLPFFSSLTFPFFFFAYVVLLLGVLLKNF